MQSQSFGYINETAYQKSKRCLSIVPGCIAIVLGISLIILQGSIMSIIAENIFNLNSDSIVFKMWQKYPVKIPLAVTFFNWTNHEDFFNRSVKPKFEEVGPFTFLQDIERVDIVRNSNNNTITFKQLRTYHYDNNLSSNGNLGDPIITFNYLTMQAGHMVKDWHDALKDTFSALISQIEPYHYLNTTVDAETLKGNNNSLMEIMNYVDFVLPDIPRMDGFAWGKLRNGDPNFEGLFNIANGVNRQFDVVNWNYDSKTHYFNESCSEVKGSMGDLYSYPLNKEFIIIYVPEICRYLTLYFEEEVKIDGIMGYKYSFTKLTLDNGTLNPENKCFCDGRCIPSGLIDISPCQFDLQVFISLPHYYNADPIYSNSVEGLNPEKQKHESYIVVEPNSLLCLEVKIGIQLNILVSPIEGVSYFDDYPKLYFPCFWADTHLQLPNDVKNYLVLYLYVPYVIIVTAILFIIMGISAICYVVFKNNQFGSQNMDEGLIENVPLNQDVIKN